MVSTTRSKSKDAFNHVLDNVFDKGDSSILKKSLKADGIEDILSLVTMEEEGIKALKYNKSVSEKNLPIPKGDQGLIKCFIKFLSHCHESGNPIGDDWMSITQEDFDLFRTSVSAMPMASPPPASSPSTSSTSSTSPSRASVYSPAQIFRRNIKRDPSLFQTLKDEKLNDNWHRSFVTQARSQDVMEVLNPGYKPTSQDDKELFDEKQKYVYSILERTVLTDVGKSIVRSHENDYDAQVAYEKLLDHHLK